MVRTINKKDDNYADEPSEMVFINPSKDVYVYERPIGILSIDAYKKEAIELLVKKIVGSIEPEFIEQPGFEIMRYQLVVKKYP